LFQIQADAPITNCQRGQQEARGDEETLKVEDEDEVKRSAKEGREQQ